jgi:uncharacterized RDD family membrane protein YckC
MNLNLPEKRVFIGPATMWKRVMAFALDFLVLDFFVLGAFSSVSERMLGGSTGLTATYRLLESNSAQTNAFVIMFMIIILLVLSYFVLLQYMLGQTVGEILFNIKVVSDLGDKRFGSVGFGQCLLRNIFIIPAVPFIFLWVIDPLYLAFARKGQRLTELLSRTRVIEQFTI